MFHAQDFPVGSKALFIHLNPLTDQFILTVLIQILKNTNKYITFKPLTDSWMFEITQNHRLSSKVFSEGQDCFLVPEFVYNHVHNIPNPPLSSVENLHTLLFLPGNPRLTMAVKGAKESLVSTQAFVEHEKKLLSVHKEKRAVWQK